jgi:hypothetical protein
VRVLQQLFGQRGHRRLGDDGRCGRQRGRQQAQRTGRQRQQQDAVAGGVGQLGRSGIAQRIQRRIALGRELGDHARGGPAGGLERLQRAAQPCTVAHRDPGRRFGGGLRLQREMHLLGVVQQPFLEQAFEHRAQARRSRTGPARQRDLVPRQCLRRRDGHHFAAGPRGQAAAKPGPTAHAT